MPVFGPKSRIILAELHPKLRQVMEHTIARSPQDFSLICGYRDEAGQTAAYKAGNTKVRYPNSAHNQTLNGRPYACAVDILPYPFKGWNDKNIHAELRAVALVAIRVGEEFGIPIRHGADWDRDGKTSDETFVDSPHIELHPWRSFTKA